MRKQITMFYSWQSDLPNNKNRGFIQSCIDMAVKNLNKSAISISADRDTAGKLGTPDIVETIFKKVDEADVFIADISIINPNTKFRKTPNPNVLLELGYAAKSLGWDRVICFINTEYGAHEDLLFDLKTRRIIPYSLEDIEKGQVRKNIASLIESTVKNLIEDGMLPAQTDVIKGNRRLLSTLLKRGIERAWDFYYQREMDLNDQYEEGNNFVAVTNAHIDMIETIRPYINEEQYFILHEMFDLLQKMKSGTEDKYDWEYAQIFVKRYLEPLYLEYFPLMEEVGLENTLTKEALDVYNALLDNTEKIVHTASRYTSEGNLVFHSDENWQEAYDKEGKLLCKTEIDKGGLITGWKKTDKYIGEYKSGYRHGKGIEYDYDVNIELCRKKEGLWYNDKLIEGKIYGAILYKNEDNTYDWETDEEGFPYTKTWYYCRDMVRGERPSNCKKYYFADMTLYGGEYKIVNDTIKPICSQVGGTIDMYCYECESIK